jgi:hypothetical protein
MKFSIFLFFVVFVCTSLFAQTNNRANNTPPYTSAAQAKQSNLIQISTPNELFNIFHSAKGSQGRQELIEAVAEKGDTLVPVLDQMLFTEKFTKLNFAIPDTGESIEVFAPQMVMGIKALEEIGSDSAYAVIAKVAATHKSLYVRSFALEAMVSSMHEKVRQGKIHPRVDAIDILIQNSEDNTFIGEHQKTVKQIANEGLIRWLGFTFDDPQLEPERKLAKKDKSIRTTRDFAQKWRKSNDAKLAWNKDTGHFELLK